MNKLQSAGVLQHVSFWGAFLFCPLYPSLKKRTAGLISAAAHRVTGFFCAILLMFAAASMGSVQASDISVRASCDPEEPIVGQYATFQITLSGDNLRVTNLPQLPSMPGILEWRSGFSASQEFRSYSINGKTTEENRYVLSAAFIPLQEGTITLPSFEIKTSAGVFQTDPIDIKVVPTPQLPISATTSGPRNNVSERAQPFYFSIKIADENKKQSYYVGETIPVDLYLMIRTPLNAQIGNYQIESSSLPIQVLKFDNSEIREKNRFTQDFQSYTYQCVVLESRIKALSAGQLDLRAVINLTLMRGQGFFADVVSSGDFSAE